MYRLLRAMKRKYFFDHKIFKRCLRRYLGRREVRSFYKHIIKGQLIDFEGKLPPEMQVVKKEGYIQFKLKPKAEAEKLLKKLIR